MKTRLEYFIPCAKESGNVVKNNFYLIYAYIWTSNKQVWLVTLVQVQLKYLTRTKMQLMILLFFNRCYIVAFIFFKKLFWIYKNSGIITFINFTSTIVVLFFLSSKWELLESNYDLYQMQLNIFLNNLGLVFIIICWERFVKMLCTF